METQTHTHLIGPIILACILAAIIGYFVPTKYLCQPWLAPFDAFFWLCGKLWIATRGAWRKLNPKR